ncbi:biotin--[acetyl-CoA-carboxylase] ligase [Haloarchaeobius iranensis]|uniref:BirA family transcriptional regulator, biotin operon repressor / biotin-[acetyl-CoA-carboxylase] ligase n=1 Tax=Haloarchaeobius iranensis TaxID=996166 RepID=A0A1G9YXM1_9EURY|nr:biotin--[acetyl-CoA-carboxylase] ligase [Haloarchaeobius iranensis]SDN13445.1 BirA family transcriptional regulator, biotin operon repressor / biotin-[acetyl-CoA-carboxylase] ligase [Haloarchaeobius iranensis]
MNETRRQVLAALADGPVSGPALAEELDVSRAAVWKHVEAIREAGFGVESDDEGYRLTSVPTYGGLAIAHELEAPYEVEYHESLASTNTRARELADDGAGDVVVVTDEQTGGRGRLDREWAAPPGGVYASILTRPTVPPSQVPLATLAAAVAVTRAAREAGVDARIKWPNDVLVAVDESTGGDGDAEYRKLAGILTEMEGEADRVSWLVVGIGVNANVDADDLPPTATSLRERVGTDIDRRVFLQRVLEEFHDLGTDAAAVLPAWREHALTLGQRVRVETPTDEVVGEAVDIEPPGALLVETDDGVVRVSAGDCEHLRPVDGS